jgi:hypothetical protein
MQRVFFGSDVYSNSILTTTQSKLDPTRLGTARRLSAVQLPWIVNSHTWPFSGQLIPGGTLTTSVELPYDDQANNPFLHTYHPDHDNLDASFKLEALVGSESYGVTRQITLSFGSVGGDFDSLTQFGQSFSGNYSEAIIMTGIMTGNGPFARTNIVAGNFSINRISTIATLTLP